MDAKVFRYFYEYHFAENHKIWDAYIPLLSQEQFTQNVDYSHGSVQNQILHLMNVDESWFSDLRGVKIPDSLNPDQINDRKIIRAHWDTVEQNMRAYLTNLRDDKLFEKPFTEGEDKDLILWQVLLHVINHGTDHRAQILRIISDFGVKTGPQDFIFYVYDHP